MSGPQSLNAAEALAYAAVHGGESPLWAREFPDFPCWPWPEVPAGFLDASWHNDVNPCLTNTRRRLTIYCAEPEPGAREWEGLARFCLCPWEGEERFESEEWREIIAALADLTPAG